MSIKLAFEAQLSHFVANSQTIVQNYNLQSGSIQKLFSQSTEEYPFSFKALEREEKTPKNLEETEKKQSSSFSRTNEGEEKLSLFARKLFEKKKQIQLKYCDLEMLQKDWNKLDLEDVENLPMRTLKEEDGEALYEKEEEIFSMKETGKKRCFKSRVIENAPKKEKMFKKICKPKVF